MNKKCYTAMVTMTDRKFYTREEEMERKQSIRVEIRPDKREKKGENVRDERYKA